MTRAELQNLCTSGMKNMELAYRKPLGSAAEKEEAFEVLRRPMTHHRDPAGKPAKWEYPRADAATTVKKRAKLIGAAMLPLDDERCDFVTRAAAYGAQSDNLSGNGLDNFPMGLGVLRQPGPSRKGSTALQEGESKQAVGMSTRMDFGLKGVGTGLCTGAHRPNESPKAEAGEGQRQLELGRAQLAIETHPASLAGWFSSMSARVGALREKNFFSLRKSVAAKSQYQCTYAKGHGCPHFIPTCVRSHRFLAFLDTERGWLTFPSRGRWVGGRIYGFSTTTVYPIKGSEVWKDRNKTLHKMKKETEEQAAATRGETREEAECRLRAIQSLVGDSSFAVQF